MLRENRLLVIDDDPEIENFVCAVAREVGYKAQAVSTAHKFWRTYPVFAPTHIFIDIVMPESDGIDLLKGLKSWHCTAPILLCSANEKYLTLARTLAAGWHLPRVRTIVKPLNDDDLKETLANLQRNALVVGDKRLVYQSGISGLWANTNIK